MKHICLSICIISLVLQLQSQNKITFKSINDFELGSSKDEIKGIFIDETDTVSTEMNAYKRYKIRKYSYKTTTGESILIAGVPFAYTSLEFAFDATLARIYFSARLTKDSVLYNIDSSEAYRLRLIKFIDDALATKSKFIKDVTSGPITAVSLTNEWKKDERNYDGKTHLHDRGNLYELMVDVSSILTEKKKVREIWISVSLTNHKYYLEEYINGKLRE